MKRSHNGRLTDSCLERPYVPSIPPESPKSTVLFSKSDSAAMRKSRGTSRKLTSGSIIHTGDGIRAKSVCHERSTQQARHESVAGFGYLVRPDHLLFRRGVSDSAAPTAHSEGLGRIPWWAVVGGLVGAVQVYAGLTLVNRVVTGHSSVLLSRLRSSPHC
jgi:hypothetical protein